MNIIMNNPAKRMLISVLVHLAICTSVAAQGEDQGSDQFDNPGKAGLHFQVGAFYRFATSVQDETKQTYLATGDLSWLRWLNSRSTWGLGVHFALDDSGYRLGLKGLWRTPLKKGSEMYFQLAPGIYLGSTDDTYDPIDPGFFFEAELGLARAFALVVAADVLPYENRTVGWTRENYWDDITLIQESGTANALYAGAKVGQEGALAATLIGAIVGLVVLISIGASGGVM
jgi:hypothetical protein